MATSMQFGPEWMRKGPTSKSGGKEASTTSTPSAATSPGTGPVAGSTAPSNGSNGNSGGKRNGGPGGLANLSGPAPVVSPSVSSPGAFSFAAAAAAATAQASDRNGTHASTHGDSDTSTSLLNGTSAALAKDKISREKLLSLYSSDRTSKNPSAEPSPVDAAPSGGTSAPERSTSTSRRKGGSDRRPSGFADFAAVGAGPLSPGLGSNEPRGLNARSTSGSSSGGFGSAGTSNWDKAEKERPGLFQRASSGALAGVTANSGSRPLSPSVSRDRFSGIQGGVLSGVAPPARKRMDSNDGGSHAVENSRAARSLKSSQDEVHTPMTTSNGTAGAGSWGRSSQTAVGQPGAIGNGGGVMGAFSDAFSSNRVRGRNATAAADAATAAAALPSSAAPPAQAVESSQPSQPTQPIVPSGNPEGLSISARFARHKERLPGEGPIGPPSDGSIGFGKSSGSDRRRERQTSQARPVTSQLARGDAITRNGGSAALQTHVSEQLGTQAQEAAPQGDQVVGSDDPDLAQHASAVLGSLKLDDDDSPGLPSASALGGDPFSSNADQLGSTTDDFLRSRDVRDQFEQPHQQPQHSTSQATMQSAPWSPETSMWLYRDMAGNVQGPFSSLMMQDWYSQQYFADDLLIKRQEDSDFKPLAQVVAAVGNALQPFIIPPSNWLHSPIPPRPAFDSNLGGADSLRSSEQSRFADSFDSNRSWAGQAARHQQQQTQQSQQQQQQHGWPSSLALGGLGNTGPGPASPFGRHDIFSSGQSGLRSQDDVMSMLRERELHEQRQAGVAASRGPGGMHLGQLDSFGGGLGRSGWGNESVVTPSHWGGIGHGGLGQFGDVGLGGHSSPLVGDRQLFDNFGHQQRQNFEQAGSPWTNAASLAPRSQFDSMRQMQQQGQWSEQQQSQQQQQQQQAAPWSYSATTPDVSNRQMDFSEALLRNEAVKAADPIGTPRRARSPAPQHDMTSAHQQADEQKTEQQTSFETAFPAPEQQEQARVDQQPTGASGAAEEKASGEQQAAEPSTEAAKTATPQKKLSKKEAQKAAAAASAAAAATPAPAVSASQEPITPAKTVETEIPPPEAFTTGEPRPEELWPQSPKAVEFASEPDLSGMSAMTLAGSKAAKDAKRESRSALLRQTSDAARGEATNRAAAAARSTGAGNVRVVSQEQFRRGNAESASASQQAPLSDWLNDGTATESPTPASRPAPWAAAKDDSASASGPSLREIQEAEAKRAEAKRAAEKAAARARLAASPSAAEELPTTLSWGLASAPATKTVNSSAGNDAAAAAAAGGSATPVWNAGKSAPKKTLMEIQEEERKRAEKLKAQQNAQAIAMRKGYADSAGRSASSTVAAPTTSSGGGAWSVVGASGKPTTPSAPAASTATASTATSGYGSAAASPLSRPGLSSVSRTSSIGSIPTSNSGTAGAWNVVGTKPTPIPPTALPASPSPATRLASAKPRASDPNAPSPEFIRYCKENLVGLTIKTDDFIDMLLQFPLDPSADVIEIIADTVYANSSTLDGRRFANDFVSKRKLDVQGRTGVSKWGAAAGSGGMGSFGTGVKPTSVPKVEKTTVKAAGGEAGFKVVKGKGAKKR